MRKEISPGLCGYQAPRIHDSFNPHQTSTVRTINPIFQIRKLRLREKTQVCLALKSDSSQVPLPSGTSRPCAPRQDSPPPLIVIQLLVIFWYQLILILQLVYGDVVLLLIYLMRKSMRTLAWPSPWKVIKSDISGVKHYPLRERQSRCLM